MNFEEAYKKYKDGTSTDEEREYVEGEIAKAKEINDLLKDDEPTVAEVATLDGERIKKAVKAFNYKAAARATIGVVVTLGILTAVALGVVFGISIYSANNSINYSEEQAVDLAKQSVAKYVGTEIGDNCVVKEADRELDLGNGLRQAIYTYDITLIVDNIEYEVEVSGESGYARIEDIDGVSDNIGSNQKKQQNNKTDIGKSNTEE